MTKLESKCTLIKRIVIIVFVVAVVAIIFINNSQMYLDYMGERAAATLEERYGKDVTVLNVEKESVFSTLCSLSTEDDLTVYCNCNMFGIVTAESYVNYNYAQDRVDEIDSIIGERLSEYKTKLSFVRLLREKGDNLELLPIKDKDATAYTKYKKITSEYHKKILVFIPEDIETTALADILNNLKDSEAVRDNYTVFFKKVPRSVYDEISDYPAIPEHSEVYNPKYYDKDSGFDYKALIFDPLKYTLGYFNYENKTELISNDE